MANASVADLFAETLQGIGVRRIYGVVGDSLNAITESLRQRGGIDWVHVRHEEAAAFAAGAEAQLTGTLAVCAGSCGPGNLHLINGLYDCHRNHVPVLAIAAHIPSSEIGLDYFQETHPEALFRECSHYVELVSNPEQFPRVLETALRTALGRRGVAVIVLPGDVALKPLPEGARVDVSRMAAPVLRPAEADLVALAQMLVHFRFFLHVSLSQKREDLLLILFSAVLLTIMVAGTIWIMASLALRMAMPASP